jgi:hypothetical protein
MSDQGIAQYLVVDGFGDFTSIESCNSVRVVDVFGSEVEAIRFAANYYDEQIAEDAEGFAMPWDSVMSYFVIVRDSASVGFEMLTNLVNDGHSIYDGEPCIVTGDAHTCASCIFLSHQVG